MTVPAPLPTGLTARDLPEIRAELATWLTDPGPDGGPAVWSAHLDPEVAAQERGAATDWAHSLRVANLYYASTDMARLAVNAGAALPSYRLHPEDLPARNGLVVWEEPVADAYPGGEYTGAPLTAATWAHYGNGVQIRTWATRENWLRFVAASDPRTGLTEMTKQEIAVLRRRCPQPIVSMHASYLPFGRIPGWLRGAPEDTAGMSLVELESRHNALGQLQQAERALVVTWLLMGQTLTSTEDHHASKASAKRIARLDPNLLTAVRYVRLRHHGVPQQDRADEPSAGTRHQHRWIVRGHWRNQYYPSRKSNRPIWIDDHLKGPDGAPILDPDKLVNILRR
ncbi:hypothetical protein ACGFZP_13365 [Kitasatospora sp. NPDC048239]|uniref:hypothetical protein n=1 Tax=Kitasatospora sp. NPDC048239 TaxID=3364046 RepID=UPI0037221C58